MKVYQDIVIPIDMSTLSVKGKLGSDPPLHMTPSIRRKVSAPMYTTEMTRAKTVNNIEEQQLNKTLKDLEKQQSKMQSEMLHLKASLLPEIKVTAAWEDKNKTPAGELTNARSSTNGHPDSAGEPGLIVGRKRSGSLPPLAFRKVAERVRSRTISESAGTGKLFAPTPPSTTGGVQRARSMNEIDCNGRPLRIPRPKSANPAATAARRGSITQPRSLNSSSESLPSDLPNSRIPNSSSTEEIRPRAQTLSTLLPLRKAKSTSNINKDMRTRCVTMDTADLTRLNRDNIFKNSSYNPVLLNPSQPRATAADAIRHRRAINPIRLSHLSRERPTPSPPEKPTLSLQDQFEQLQKCRYLRVPSEDSDQET